MSDNSRKRKLPVIQLDNLKPILRPDQLREPEAHNGVVRLNDMLNDCLPFQIDHSDPLLQANGEFSSVINPTSSESDPTPSGASNLTAASQPARIEVARQQHFETSSSVGETRVDRSAHASQHENLGRSAGEATLFAHHRQQWQEQHQQQQQYTFNRQQQQQQHHHHYPQQQHYQPHEPRHQPQQQQATEPNHAIRYDGVGHWSRAHPPQQNDRRHTISRRDEREPPRARFTRDSPGHRQPQPTPQQQPPSLLASCGKSVYHAQPNPAPPPSSPCSSNATRSSSTTVSRNQTQPEHVPLDAVTVGGQCNGPSHQLAASRRTDATTALQNVATQEDVTRQTGANDGTTRSQLEEPSRKSSYHATTQHESVDLDQQRHESSHRHPSGPFAGMARPSTKSTASSSDQPQLQCTRTTGNKASSEYLHQPSSQKKTVSTSTTTAQGAGAPNDSRRSEANAVGENSAQPNGRTENENIRKCPGELPLVHRESGTLHVVDGRSQSPPMALSALDAAAQAAPRPSNGAALVNARSGIGKGKTEAEPELLDTNKLLRELEKKLMQKLYKEILAAEEKELMSRLDREIAAAEARSRPFRSPQAKQTCTFFFKNGYCGFGTKCKFSHERGSSNSVPVLKSEGSITQSTWLCPRWAPGWSHNMTVFTPSDFEAFRKQFVDAGNLSEEEMKSFRANVEVMQGDPNTYKVVVECLSSNSQSILSIFGSKFNRWIQSRIRGCNFCLLDRTGSEFTAELDPWDRVGAEIKQARYWSSGIEKDAILIFPSPGGQLWRKLHEAGIVVKAAGVKEFNSNSCRTFDDFKRIVQRGKKAGNRVLRLSIMYFPAASQFKKTRNVCENEKTTKPEAAGTVPTQSLNSAYIRFLEKIQNVVSLEYVCSGSGIVESCAYGSMWKQHKASRFGATCQDDCECIYSLPMLTCKVVSDFMASKTSAKWGNPLHLSYKDYPAGLCGSFAARFLRKLKSEYPSDKPVHSVERLKCMWKHHTVVYGKSCGGNCKCYEGWGAGFRKGDRNSWDIRSLDRDSRVHNNVASKTSDVVARSTKLPGSSTSERSRPCQAEESIRVTKKQRLDKTAASRPVNTLAGKEERQTTGGTLRSSIRESSVHRKRSATQRFRFCKNGPSTKFFSCEMPPDQFVHLTESTAKRPESDPGAIRQFSETVKHGTFHEVSLALERGALRNESKFSFLEELYNDVRKQAKEPDPSRDTQLKDKILKIYIRAAQVYLASMSLNDWTGFEIVIDRVDGVPSSGFSQIQNLSIVLTGLFGGEYGSSTMDPNKPLGMSTWELRTTGSITFRKPARTTMHHNTKIAKERALIVKCVGKTVAGEDSVDICVGRIKLSSLLKDVEKDREWFQGTCSMEQTTTKDLPTSMTITYRARRMAPEEHNTKKKKRDAQASRIKEVINWIKRFNNEELTAEERITKKLSFDVPVFQRATLLHSVIRIREAPLAELLLRAGADVAFASALGSPLLFCANQLDSATDGFGKYKVDCDNDLNDNPVVTCSSLDKRRGNLLTIHTLLAREYNEGTRIERV